MLHYLEVKCKNYLKYYLLFTFLEQYAVEKVYLGQIFEMNVLENLHILMSSKSKNSHF